MKNIFYIAIAMLIASCAKEEKQEQTDHQQITLQATLAEHTKATATAFEAGDELGLFVTKSGQDIQRTNNLVNNARLLTLNDGTIKGDPTPVYYPNSTSQVPSPTSLYSYYPYQSGDATADALGVQVGIRTDQTDFSAIKRSDLCFGFLDNVEPSNSAKPITFKHSFAQVRINISTYVGCEAVKQVRLINIKDSALLNIQTGAISLKSHLAEVKTNKSAENSFLAIIPAQTFSGACIAIDLENDKTFIYNAVNPINLKQSATNTLNLNINDKHVVTLNGTPIISNWTTINSSGTISSAVNNQISLYWLAPHADYAAADKVTLTITDPLNVTREIDIVPAVDAKSSSQYAVYNLNIALDNATYPLTISRIETYNGSKQIGNCEGTAIEGKVLYKEGVHKVGMRTNCILINGIWWQTYNVGAVNKLPTDYGNYYNWEQAMTACPPGWRLPTVQEHIALASGGYSSRTTINGISGWWVGSKTVNGPNSIFFPAAGWRETDGTIYYPVTHMFYWSSTSVSSTYAYNMRISPEGGMVSNHSDRKNAGFSVRCVQ